MLYNAVVQVGSVPNNGILFFVGINEHQEEICEVIIPPNPVNEFTYICSKKFNIDRFLSLFKEGITGSVIFISGNETLIYRYEGSFRKIRSITANIAKRHKKGGQSSLRFSRLAEESRDSYTSKVVDELNTLLVGSSINWIFGGQELRDQVLSHCDLRVKLNTGSAYHSFTSETINDPHFRTLMTSKNETLERQLDIISELLERNPDYLLFSSEEIEEHSDDIEFVVNVKDIPYNSVHYAQLRHFQKIAKLYFVVREN